jgi:MFS family permease
MLFGLVTLAGATAMLQTSSSIAALVSGRIIQGISAAIVWTVGLALLVDTVGQCGIGMALGWVGTSASISQLVAPMLGGVVFDKGSYDDVFSIAYALLALDIALRILMIEKKEAKRWDGADTTVLPPAFTDTRWPAPVPLQYARNEEIGLSDALKLNDLMVTALPRPPTALLSPHSSLSSNGSGLPTPISARGSFSCYAKPSAPSQSRQLPPLVSTATVRDGLPQSDILWPRRFWCCYDSSLWTGW